jgi:hypothetical protein
MMMTKFLTTALMMLSALLVGCGSGGNATTPPSTMPTVIVTPYVPGTGFLEIDQPAINLMNQVQANSATLSLIADGGTTVLSITTPATAANPAGRFVGGGTGNKAIVQLDGFDGLKLSDLAGVELDAKLVTGAASNFYMNFLVDLDCVKNEDLTTMTIADIRANRRIIVWIPGAGVVQPDGYTRYNVSPTDSQWLIVGSPTLSMGPNPSGPATPLGLTGFPNACIVDGVSADGGLPRNLNVPACVTGAALPTTASASCGAAHKGALILLGDSNNLAAKTYNVKRVKIKERVIVFR